MHFADIVLFTDKYFRKLTNNYRGKKPHWWRLISSPSALSGWPWDRQSWFLRQLFIFDQEKYMIFGGSACLPRWFRGKEPACQYRRYKRCGFDLWVSKIPWRRAWKPTLVFLLDESPRTEEPGGLQSMGSQGVRHYWSDLARTWAYECWCRGRSLWPPPQDAEQSCTHLPCNSSAAPAGTPPSP